MPTYRRRVQTLCARELTKELLSGSHTSPCAPRFCLRVATKDTQAASPSDTCMLELPFRRKPGSGTAATMKRSTFVTPTDGTVDVLSTSRSTQAPML
eukprot:scaffold367_cov254-Pinguiococcus_pyrenoidosus.AAC.19